MLVHMLPGRNRSLHRPVVEGGIQRLQYLRTEKNENQVSQRTTREALKIRSSLPVPRVTRNATQRIGSNMFSALNKDFMQPGKDVQWTNMQNSTWAQNTEQNTATNFTSAVTSAVTCAITSAIPTTGRCSTVACAYIKSERKATS